MPLFILNFDKFSVFQAVTTGYIKSYQSKKSLKVVNNTLTIWWSLTYWSLTCFDDRWFARTLTQISVNWYSWQTWLRARSSHRRRSVRKSVLRNFSKFTGKHLCQNLFFNKVAGPQLYWQDTSRRHLLNSYALLPGNVSFLECF